MTDEEMAEDYAVTNWEWYEDGQRDYIAIKQAFLAGLKAGRPKWHIEELEKENAELKADYKVLSCSVGNFEELQNKLEEEQGKNNVLSDNLTQAKELLRELYVIVKVWCSPFFKDEHKTILMVIKEFLQEE